MILSLWTSATALNYLLAEEAILAIYFNVSQLVFPVLVFSSYGGHHIYQWIFFQIYSFTEASLIQKAQRKYLRCNKVFVIILI